MALIAWHDGPAVTEGFNLRTTWLYYDPSDPANSNVGLQSAPVKVLHAEVIYLKPVDTGLNVLAARLQAVGKQVAEAQQAKTGFNAAVIPGFPVIIDGV